MSKGAFLFFRRAAACIGIFAAAVVVGRFFLPQLVSAQPTASVQITALHYYGREATADEAIRLTNTSAETITLDASWSLSAAVRHRRTHGELPCRRGDAGACGQPVDKSGCCGVPEAV